MKSAVIALVFCSALAAQTLSIEEYEPKSTLVVPEHTVKRAKYPFIDVHNHQYDLTPAKVDKLVSDMDGINLRIMVNLSGGYGESTKEWRGLSVETAVRCGRAGACEVQLIRAGELQRVGGDTTR